MRIAQVFIWSGDRPDGHDDIRSIDIPHQVTHQGVHFTLRTWDIRYTQGQDRITDAIYDEVVG